MKNRRRFISVSLKSFAMLGLLLSPGMRLVRTAWGKIKKIILPKNTKMADLINKNPSELDTRNLAPTPLNEFDTMGITRYEVELEDWSFKIEGLVRDNLNLSYVDLNAIPSVERDVLLICPGFFAQHGKWKGVDMLKLLDSAGVDPEATDVVFSSLAGLSERTETFSLEEVRSNKVFLAYRVNGEMLPEKHGFPLRLVAEDSYGSHWLKYVNSMEVTKL